MDETLDQFLERKRQAFSAKVGRALEEKARVSDLRRYFTIEVHKRFPNLAVVWQEKHTGPAKVLLRYGADLPVLIQTYLDDPYYQRNSTISFDSFYRIHEQIVSDLARAARSAEWRRRQEAYAGEN